MFLLYDFFFIIFAVLYLPYVLIRRKWHNGFLARFGFLPPEVAELLRLKDNIWVHAVSVGEVLAVTRFVEELQARYPEKHIVISTVTPTGNDLAKKQFPFATVLYAPFDFSLSVKAYLDEISPALYISAETEIWPNMFYALYRRGIPIIQVNGRISDKSFKQYKRFRFAVKPILSYVRCFCMQTEIDAQRVIDIGASSQKVFVTGNMKFDEDLERKTSSYGQIFQNHQAPVLAAGSTHPGEEEIVLTIFQKLRSVFPGLGLILAPRHVERTEDVAALIKQHGMGFCRLSEIMEKHMKADDVVLVDTIGHLRHLYRYATVVFIGKSLIGRGGQNIIEPASLGKPVIIGPHMENFRSVRDLMVQSQAVVVVQNAKELEEAFVSLLSDPAKGVMLGKNAKAAVEEQKGAVSRTLDRIERIQRMVLF